MRLAAAALALQVAGCGYQLANAGGSAERIVPELVQLSRPNARAAQALLAGARAELARSGALADVAGVGAGVLELELVGFDERADALSTDVAAAVPTARAVRVRVTGRARLTRGGRLVLDTGVVADSELVAVASNPAGGEMASTAAGATAAKRLGTRLARKALGFPEP